MTTHLLYLYLLSPLHTGGTSNEGNVLGIARETHTDMPYIPSSSIRGRFRADFTDTLSRVELFGPDLDDLKDSTFLTNYKNKYGRDITQLEQGGLWIGDASLLWMPVASLSHGVVWISCPLLLQRWARFARKPIVIPTVYSASSALTKTISPLYLKDARIPAATLQAWSDTDAKQFVPNNDPAIDLSRLLVLPDQHCQTLIQMSLWRQVKVKLNEHKAVQGGSFRYEEAIPPDSLLYFPWGSLKNAPATNSETMFTTHLTDKTDRLLQIGGQEGLGRGFTQYWLSSELSTTVTTA